ncbi:proton-conducting transporter membrane subunit [Aquabacterium sp.]|uniref:proton-conducting transporter transmembrane domain-containing protein n=1 Tax=Aquabacterium sp. TaxID=1872578 RepID=UPI003784C325
MSLLLATQWVLLLGAALCLLPLPNTYRASLGIAAQALAVVLVWMAVAPVLAGGAPLVGDLPWAHPVGTLRIRLDGLGAFFLAWSVPMTLLGSVYAAGYLRPHFATRRHVGVHYALLNLTALSFVLVYSADHALVFLLGWEIAALAAWLLVIWDYTNQKVRFAGFNYLVSTHVGLIFLVAGFMILYTHAGSWDLGSFGLWLRTHPGAERNLVFLLLLTSFALKSAFFPFHSWLPRAHAAAPAHVSALMSGVIHKAGLYALVRLLLMMGRPDEWMGWFLLGFGALSAAMGALYTVSQRDLKRLLGYSSTENVGIAAMGLGVGSLGLAWQQPVLVALGFASGLMHVLNHAFFKCQLFYAAGAVYQAAHGVDMEKLGGLARLMPWTALSFLVGGIAISALPPFNGFTSEFPLYSGLFTDQPVPVWAKVALAAAGAVLAFVGALSALSITRAFGVVFLGSPRDASATHATEVGWCMRAPLLLHGLGVVVLGLVPALGLALVQATTALALAEVPAATGHELAAVGGTLGRIGALSGLLVGAAAALWGLRRMLARAPGASHVTWGCGYTAVGPRMQYTGSSFSWDFAQRFRRLMVLLHRHKAPQAYFPTDAYVVTDCVDAVERRLYAVIGHGDSSAADLSRQLREDDPRPAFAAGLIALVVIAGLIVISGGALR